MTQVQDHPALSTAGTIPAAAPAGFRHIDVTKVGGIIGAVVSGIRVGAGLEPGRGRRAAGRAAAAQGRVPARPAARHRRRPARLRRAARPAHQAAPDGRRRRWPCCRSTPSSSKANSWHTDVTFVDRVPAISILRAHHAAALRRDDGVGQHGRGLPAAAPRPPGPGRPPARGAHQPLRLRRRAAPGRRHRRQAAGLPRRSSGTWSSRPSTRSSASTRRPASRRCCSATSSGRSSG